MSKMKMNFKFIGQLMGYSSTNWTRVVMNRECASFIKSLSPSKLNVLEISGSGWETFGFSSYKSVHFPSFDICKETLDEKFDLIIAEQVLEHVSYPGKACQNIYGMLKKDGYFYISTPFLYPIHEAPQDCTRWTQTGLKYLLQEAGFPLESIVTDSWGNRKIVKTLVSSSGSLFLKYKKYKKYIHLKYNKYIHSLKNEEELPVVVWAFAKK